LAANHDDVLGQLQAAGLEVDHFDTGRMVRCRVKGDREKRGWYVLHELVGTGGDTIVVGSYGIWTGASNNAQKVTIRTTDFNNEQLASMRRRMAEDRKRADQARAKEAERAAAVAAKSWAKCSPTGDAEYLKRKGVSAHGIRFSPSGAIVLPLLDVAGQIHGLQVIRTAAEARANGRPAKEFWPRGVIKKGHFHLIGLPASIVLVAEGYATAASLHEATGLPTAVAYDAGNLAPVCVALHKRYKTAKILICADDDAGQKCNVCGERVWTAADPINCPSCTKPHGALNAGISMASSAAVEVGGAWVYPRFSDDVARRAKFEAKGDKLTDFNDLHALEGLHVVRHQIEARISELGWRVGNAAARHNNSGGGGRAPLHKIQSADELLERFSLVYGQGGMVFDHVEHCLISLSDMRDACTRRELHRAWAEHPDQSIVRVRNVGFDPGGDDREILCNLWAGWPTEPKPGKCQLLFDLLRHMCSADSNPEMLYRWILCWLAYPIQHPGAKMKTTLVLHGPQGTGKNMFFEAVMAIYGQYGRVVDQSAIEDKFNDWASRKLFLIADEVIARSEVYHIKNRLKAFITGEWIRINPKNLAAYDERNHVNLVFLSNETMPVVLEEDDRRHAVIWTPDKLKPEFYAAVKREIADGGVEALHDYLLHVDLGDFNTATLPPFNGAKSELINQSLDSTTRFFYDLNIGDIGNFGAGRVEIGPALSTDLYELYRLWCQRQGIPRPAPLVRLTNALSRRHKVPLARKRWMGKMGLEGPHGMVMLGSAASPDGVAESTWLGDCVAAFRTALYDYKTQGTGNG
jgi:putative DNA primase/helicase